MALVFRIKNLTYSYPDLDSPDSPAAPRFRMSLRRKPSGRRTVFEGLSLEFRLGAITAVVGRSGIGKSTLLHILGLLDDQRYAPETVQYFPGVGTDPFDYGSLNLDRNRLRSQYFGFALQSSYLMPTLTCAENIMLPLQVAGCTAEFARHRAKACVQAAELVRNGDALWRRAKNLPSKVSGGERQRYAFLRAVIGAPHVLFADEPFSNIDHHSADRIETLMRQWHAGTFPPVNEESLAQDGTQGETLISSNERERFDQKKSHESSSRSLLLVTHDLERALTIADDLVVVYEDAGITRTESLSRADLSPNVEHAEQELRRRLLGGRRT